MDITVNVAEFYRCLDTVEKALPTRSSMDALNNILLSVSKDKLTFYATNLELEIKTSMSAVTDDNLNLLLPPKIIEIMQYFPTQEAAIHFDPDNYRIDIHGGKADFNLYGADSQDYPKTDFSSELSLKTFSINQPSFKQLLKMVLFAASTDETRPAFNGVFMELSGNEAKLTASDTYRLAVKKMSNNQWNFEPLNCLVPAKALRECIKFLGDDEQVINILPREKSIAFDFGNVYLCARLLQDKFPDISSIIPLEYRSRFILDRGLFEKTIARAALLAEGKNLAVKLSFEKDNLIARVNSQQGKMEESLPVKSEGDDIELYVNTRFVLDFLRVAETNEITIDTHGLEGPLVFKPGSSTDFTYLVLPIRKTH